MKSRILSAILLATAGLSLVAADALAIPAFARKYKFSCTTCHAPAPRLKAYGEEFAGNGFRVPDGAEPIRAYRDTGDELLTLQSDLPLAVRLDAWVSYENYDGLSDQTDLKTPWAVKLLSGGNIAPSVGYYFYFYASEHGEVVGLEDAYVHFNDLGGVPLDLMVGQFQISDPMMKRELRLSYEDYETYRRAPGSSQSTLTYDRGIMMTYDTPFGLGLVAEVVNGNGIRESDQGNYDADRDKGYAGRATYESGPVMVGGFYASVAIGEIATVTAQYLVRNDSRPDPVLEDVDTDGVVVELVIQPAGPDAKDHVVLLYNRVDSDDDSIDYETWTASWSHLHRRNLRMVAELTWDNELEGLRSLVGFSSAF
jgi:hypothetical protein